MSEGQLSKIVAVQPREFETEDMIEIMEPFIDKLPQFLRDLFQHYKDTYTKYDESTRKEEIRAKQKG